MKHLIQPSRLAAAATGLVLVAGTFAASSPAQARSHTSGKTYKTGAIALGVVGAYFLSRGKTVEGAALLGGGVLAYKKGQGVQKDERYGRYNYPRYGYNNRTNAPNDRYTNNRFADQNQSGNWNSGWHGQADVRPQRDDANRDSNNATGDNADYNRDSNDQNRDNADFNFNDRN